jgi:hypothetical protein
MFHQQAKAPPDDRPRVERLEFRLDEETKDRSSAPPSYPGAR